MSDPELSALLKPLTKRGRKPKVAAAVALTTPVIEDHVESHDKPVINHDTQHFDGAATSNGKSTRRGRKPKAVYNGFGESIDTVNAVSDDENVIMKLKVNSQCMYNDECGYDTANKEPDAYNPMPCYMFESKPVELNEMDDVVNMDASMLTSMPSFSSKQEADLCFAHTPCPHVNNLKVINLLRDFEEKNKNNEWPSNTSIACYWCCHRFDNAPFGIPVKYDNGTFFVYGCFCSLECASAYNLNNKETNDEMWERYSLINLLARKIGYAASYVKPAPNKLTLKYFGGHLSIEEFRRYTNTNKMISINFPPMMTMTQQIEEINESDVNNDFKFIPVDTDRINRYKEKIKLKRNKPFHNMKDTLDQTMNIKFGVSV